MKKTSAIFIYFLLFFLIIAFNPPCSQASEQRLKGMALDGSTSWMLQKDFAYIGLNPAYTSMFGPMIWAAWTPLSGSNPDGNGALLFQPSPSLSIYAITGSSTESEINSDNTELGMFNIAPAYYAPGTQNIDVVADHTSGYDITKEQIRVDGAYKMSNATIIGATIGYSQTKELQKDEVAETTEDYNRSQIKIGAGIFYDLGQGSDFDAAIKIILLGIDNSYKDSSAAPSTTISYEDDNAYNVTLNGRYNRKLSETSIMHAFLSLNLKNYSTKASIDGAVNGSDNFERTGNSVTLGASDEMKINKTYLLFFGGQLTRYSSELNFSGEDNAGADTAEVNYTGSGITLPVMAGVEGKLSENLTGRFGVSHSVWNMADGEFKDASTTEDWNPENPTVVSIGASYVLEKFTFEFVVNKQIFTTGPNFITNSSLGNMTSDFVIIYFWE